MRTTFICAVMALLLGVGTASASSAPTPPAQSWSFTSNIWSGFDHAALRRGFQVYADVCSGCHSLKLVAYRNLMAIGLNEGEVREFAGKSEVEDGPNDAGEMFKRPALPSDRFVSPFPNDNAARAANSGALPPDLSLIIKARKSGPDYLFGLMTGYRETPPEGVQMTEGKFYNDYFPGHQISMPPPLTEDGVTYADGTKATVEQMARDVVQFLAWTASPELEARKSMGIKVLIFLAGLTALLFALKRKIWADLH